jgi:hypothetical protein
MMKTSSKCTLNAMTHLPFNDHIVRGGEDYIIRVFEFNQWKTQINSQ